MTAYAKWITGTDIVSGVVPREMFPLQESAGATLVAMDVYYAPDALYVSGGILKRASDDAVVSVEYLTDEMLSDMATAAFANAPDSDTGVKCAQHLKSAQTITEAEAIIASYGIDISKA